MMHKESPPAKNSFLEDLDKLEVSESKNAEQFRGMCNTLTVIDEAVKQLMCEVCVSCCFFEFYHILLLKSVF